MAEKIYYYAIAEGLGSLYILTELQQKEFEKLFPDWFKDGELTHERDELFISFIESNGKFIDNIQICM